MTRTPIAIEEMLLMWAKEIRPHGRDFKLFQSAANTRLVIDGDSVNIAAASDTISWAQLAQALLPLGKSCAERHEEDESSH